MTEIVVTQADEKACSAALAAALDVANNCISIPAMDQAFARHRIASTAALRPPEGEVVEVVAELQLAAFLAGRGSVTSMKHGTRTAKPAPTMDEFRRMALTSLEPHIQARVDAERERCAKVAARYMLDDGRLHPDLQPEEIGSEAQNIAHMACQYVADAICALEEKPDE